MCINKVNFKKRSAHDVQTHLDFIPVSNVQLGMVLVWTCIKIVKCVWKVHQLQAKISRDDPKVSIWIVLGSFGINPCGRLVKLLAPKMVKTYQLTRENFYDIFTSKWNFLNWSTLNPNLNECFKYSQMPLRIIWCMPRLENAFCIPKPRYTAVECK